ncbi:MAG: DUF2169 domain-containing protein [Desulfamplus sp.]|nr:DUF2169 domain-containing protein [Desulfamplus sp.]
MTNEKGQDIVNFMVKATYEIAYLKEEEKYVPKPVEEQHAIRNEVEYYNKPGASLIKYDIEISLPKPQTDVILIGNARGPSESGNSTLVSIDVSIDAGDNKHKVDKKSTILEGQCIAEKFGFVLPTPPGKNSKPVTEGELRSIKAGTFKPHTWDPEKPHILPSDFNSGYFNAAQSALIVPGYFSGGEKVEIINVSPHSKIEFYLPKVSFKSVLKYKNKDRYQSDLPENRKETYLNLDTVIIDIDINKMLLYLIWRGGIPIQEKIQDILWSKTEEKKQNADNDK